MGTAHVNENNVLDMEHSNEHPGHQACSRNGVIFTMLQECNHATGRKPLPEWRPKLAVHTCLHRFVGSAGSVSQRYVGPHKETVAITSPKASLSS